MAVNPNPDLAFVCPHRESKHGAPSAAINPPACIAAHPNKTRCRREAKLSPPQYNAPARIPQRRRSSFGRVLLFRAAATFGFHRVSEFGRCFLWWDGNPPRRRDGARYALAAVLGLHIRSECSQVGWDVHVLIWKIQGGRILLNIIKMIS